MTADPKARRPRALLVGDNRHTPNWGGRAAGMALVDLLSTGLDVSATVEGREFLLESAGYGIIAAHLPAQFDDISRQAWLGRSRRSIYHWYVNAGSLIGLRDVVADDPADSARAMLRYRHRVPEVDRICQAVTKSDVVVVNGEGDFVFTTPPRREVLFMLALMELALQAGKPVCFVNAMLSDCPFTGRHAATVAATHRLLARCALVIVRDPESLVYVHEHMPGVEATLVPDALFGWYPRAEALAAGLPAKGDLLMPHPCRQHWLGRLDLSQPYIAVGGTAAAATNPVEATARFTSLVAALKGLGLPLVLTANDNADDFLDDVATRTGVAYVPVATPIYAAAGILGRARLFVSGRYHPAIMASLTGTPCVFLGSTAHKMASLQALLGYESPRTFGAFPTPDEIAAILALGRDYLDREKELRHRIEPAARARYDQVSQLPRLIGDALGGRGAPEVVHA